MAGKVSRGLKIDIDIFLICEKRTLRVNPLPLKYGLYTRENVENIPKEGNLVLKMFRGIMTSYPFERCSLAFAVPVTS